MGKVIKLKVTPRSGDMVELKGASVKLESARFLGRDMGYPLLFIVFVPERGVGCWSSKLQSMIWFDSDILAVHIVAKGPLWH